MKKLFLTTLISFFVVLLSGAYAGAHMVWLNANDYSPELGQTVFVEIGFGHKFPCDQVIQEKQIQEVYALNPEGKKIKLEKIFTSFYRFTPESEGCYQLMAKLNPGFVSKTPAGHQLGNKKQVEQAVSCFRFNMTAKAVVEVGGSANGLENKSDHALQLIPLKNPSDLSLGEKLPIKALFKGQPQAGVTIDSTYKGYKDHWVAEAKTDEKGLAQFEINHKGPWLFRAKYYRPYPDKSVCDKYFYCSSLNLGF